MVTYIYSITIIANIVVSLEVFNNIRGAACSKYVVILGFLEEAYNL